ncbi:MAG: 50S ribosomal protein L6 [Kiritimatiellae bacterium]|jgi:large subunit ribosomal protein L6|nr:50S ribosomal protein L6 [Kiritimatiellia bacterium]
MSRIGKNPIAIPEGVTVTVDGQTVAVKGKLGELSRDLVPGISVKVEDNTVYVDRADDSRIQKSCHGLSRSLIFNMIEGVVKGYKKELTIEGTGFKAVDNGKILSLSLGFASPKDYAIPEGIKVTIDKGGVKLAVEGISKELVGQAAARIRSYYPAEPYKGKGIKYAGEVIRRKQGKTVA